MAATKKPQEPKPPAKMPEPKESGWRCLKAISGWFEGSENVTFEVGNVYEGQAVEWAVSKYPDYFEKA